MIFRVLSKNRTANLAESSPKAATDAASNEINPLGRMVARGRVPAACGGTNF
jgi:hypothetical protein